VLREHPDREGARRDRARPAVLAEHPPDQRRYARAASAREPRLDEKPVCQPLEQLGDGGRQPAARLHARQVAAADVTAAQRRGEESGRRRSVCDSEVDPDSAHRRHRVRRVPDAQQSLAVPARHPVETNGKQLDVIPRSHGVDAIGKLGSARSHALSKAR
jgi:hypothetical protein